MIIKKGEVIFRKEDSNFVKMFGLMKAAEVALEHKSKHKTPFIHDLFQLAEYVGLGKKDFFSLLKNVNNEYEFFKVKKKNGGFRKIHAPSSKLRRTQKIHS